MDSNATARSSTANPKTCPRHVLLPKFRIFRPAPICIHHSNWGIKLRIAPVVRLVPAYEYHHYYYVIRRKATLFLASIESPNPDTEKMGYHHFQIMKMLIDPTYGVHVIFTGDDTSIQCFPLLNKSFLPLFPPTINHCSTRGYHAVRLRPVVFWFWSVIHRLR